MTLTGGLYRRMTLAAIMADESSGPRSVRVVGLLQPTRLDVPALAFGDGEAALVGASPRPRDMGSGPTTVSANAPRFFVLRDAVVHVARGVVTLADRVVAETLAHVPAEEVPSVAAAQLPIAARVAAGYHLLAGNDDNYFHVVVDAVARFCPDALGSFGTRPPILLIPQADCGWKRELFDLALPADCARLAVGQGERVWVEQLLYVSDLSGGGFRPHARALDLFDVIAKKARAGASPRRLYISRADSGRRVLVNEAAVTARVERAGFHAVSLSGMSVLAQARLFAGATHIVAPHGAGLTNLGFCRAGTVLCELHSPIYVNWAFRALAARRGVEYGCLVGRGVGADRWELDLAKLDHVLAESRFC